MAALDTDGSCTISGGTFIGFGAVSNSLKQGSGVYRASFGSSSGGNMPGGGGGGGHGGGPGRAIEASSYSFSSGDYTLKLNSDYSFTLSATYSMLVIVSNDMSSNGSYSLIRGTTTVVSWTQSSTTYSG